MLLCGHPTRVMEKFISVIIDSPFPPQDLTSIWRLMWYLEDRFRDSVIVAADTQAP